MGHQIPNNKNRIEATQSSLYAVSTGLLNGITHWAPSVALQARVIITPISLMVKEAGMLNIWLKVTFQCLAGRR